VKVYLSLQLVQGGGIEPRHVALADLCGLEGGGVEGEDKGDKKISNGSHKHLPM